MSITPIPKNQVRSRGKIEQHEHCDIADARRTKLVDELGNPINSSNPLPIEGTIMVTPQARANSTPEQQIITLALAGDIETFDIPIRTLTLELSERDGKTDFRYAFGATDIGNGIFKTVPCGNSVVLSEVYNQAIRTVYVQADSDNTVIEIETYSEQ